MTRTVALRGAKRQRTSHLTRVYIRVLRMCAAMFALVDEAVSPVGGRRGVRSTGGSANCRRAVSAGMVRDRRGCLMVRSSTDECGRRRERRPMPRRCPRAGRNRRRRDAGGAE